MENGVECPPHPPSLGSTQDLVPPVLTPVRSMAYKALGGAESFLCLLVKGHLQQSSPEVAATHGAAGTLTRRRVRAEVPTQKDRNKPWVASAKHVTTQF